MKITILEGPFKGREFDFTSPSVTIGRDGGNQLILDTDGVSRCHAEIKQLADGSWIISDLNSTNGVKIGGVRIDGSAPMTDGCVAVIGENSLQITQLSQEPARVIFNPIISAPPPQPPLFSGAAGGASETPLPAQAVEETPSPSQSAKEGPMAPPEGSAPGESTSKVFSGVDIKNLSGSLFGSKGRKRSSSAAVPGAGSENDPKKKRSNLIFYTVLVCVVIMVLSSVFSVMNPSRGSRKKIRQELPLDVSYEKTVFSKDNVFRFSFKLVSFRAAAPKKGAKGSEQESTPPRKYDSKILFTIDDISSRRHFEREVPLSAESVDELRQVIRSSGIYAAANKGQENDDSVIRRLTVVDGNTIFRTAVSGKYAPTEFSAVEEAVINLTETFGVKAISMTPAELIAMARKSFANAEDYYANRRAGATNLRNAIKHYKIAVESLEQFSPKPPQWEEARIKLAEAVKEREIMLGALETEYKKLIQLRSLDAMKPIFRQMMDLTEPESPRHAAARRRLIRIEQFLREKKR